MQDYYHHRSQGAFYTMSQFLEENLHSVNTKVQMGSSLSFYLAKCHFKWLFSCMPCWQYLANCLKVRLLILVFVVVVIFRGKPPYYPGHKASWKRWSIKSKWRLMLFIYLQIICKRAHDKNVFVISVGVQSPTWNPESRHTTISYLMLSMTSLRSFWLITSMRNWPNKGNWSSSLKWLQGAPFVTFPFHSSTTLSKAACCIQGILGSTPLVSF